MGSAVAHRHAEPLGRADRDVGAEVAGRAEEHTRQQVGRDDRLRAELVHAFDGGGPVGQRAGGRGIFALDVTKPANWTKFVTSLVDIRTLSSEQPLSGMTFDWTYRMLGMNFEGRGSVVDFEEDRQFSMEMEGSFPIRETYAFAKESNGTVLTVTVHYEVPGKVLGAIANKLVVEKMNAKEAEAVLKKIKAICEAKKV